MSMINASVLSLLVLLVAQILLDIASGYPIESPNGASNKLLNRFKRSLQPVCARKVYLKETDGIISVNQGHRLHSSDVSCSWIVRFTRGQLAQLEFSKFNIEDPCPGICQCNFVAVKEHYDGSHMGTRRFCNERKPPRGLLSGGDKIRIHLRLKAGSQTRRTSFLLRYSTISDERTPQLASRQNSEDMLTHYIEKNTRHPSNHGNEASNARMRKQVPSAEVSNMKTVQPTEDLKPSKLTILLAVAVPVVLIFLLVVLLIAYYYNYMDKKTKESGEDIPKSGTTISDLIMNSSVTLTPMFNLGKARRESSNRREKANKLYDDMLQNWRQTNANKMKREKAKEESAHTWETYKKNKQRRNTREVEENDNQAFAMLVSNAINVDINDNIEEVEEKPRTSSILKRNSSENIRHSRGSKVLSWSDVSTTKPKDDDDEDSKKRAKSETELKISGSGSGSGHIPAIVVSQPSFETEDDEPEATDTDRLIKDDKGSPKKPAEEESTEGKKATYSCSEHVKDILRGSYGDEIEELFVKPKKSASQGSLPQVSDSNVKYESMKTTEDDDDDHEDID